MDTQILIFIPGSLARNKTGFLEGFYKNNDDCETYFITNEMVLKTCEKCIGFTGSSSKTKFIKPKSIYFHNQSDTFVVNNVNSKKQSVVQIEYDFKAFKNSNVINSNYENYGKHFQTLTDELRKTKSENHKNGRIRNWFILSLMYCIDLILKSFKVLKSVTSHSATLSHFEESLVTFRRFLRTAVVEKEISPKLGNLMLSKVIDLFLGIIILNLCLNYEEYIVYMIEKYVQDIIKNLKGLLIYIMGSPIGLKLNYAFNHCLGTFFFYHINLWRVFLQALHPLLYSYFRFVVLPGTLGFSFQIAMFSDIISIATFHVHCIYVYAARLFSLQVKGLNSLWKLFIGRKYNPLRERVDSCEYSPNQLFVGTLGFTMLLFLLPTTMMYYTVFTAFRLVILIVTSFLSKIRHSLNSLPLYVFILWLLNSPCIAGTLYIEWKNNNENDNVKIMAKLNTLPLQKSIQKFVPVSVKPLENISLTNLFYNIVVGVLI